MSEFGRIVKGHIIYKLADGTVVPGTTTITGQLAKPHLPDWAAGMARKGLDHRAIFEEAGRVGTLAHEMVRCQLAGREPDLAPYSKNQIALARNGMDKFQQYAGRHELKPLFLECPLVSEAHGYGGTIDYYGLLGGVPALLDWKTGSGIYREHYLQAAAYWNLLVENDHPVETVRILRIGREDHGGYEEHNVSRLEERFAVFLHLLEVYRGMEALG